MRLFNRGDIPRVDWLDPLTMAVRVWGERGGMVRRRGNGSMWGMGEWRRGRYSWMEDTLRRSPLEGGMHFSSPPPTD